MQILNDILAALGVVLNAIPQAILAMAFGFAMVPTAIAYVIGIGGNLAYQSALPISMQAETITLAGTMGKDIRERISMVLFAGVAMIAFGAFGILQIIQEYAGVDVVTAMMVGVGIILTRVAINMAKENKLVGIVSIASALLIHLFTNKMPNSLVYTIVGSVIISSIVSVIVKGKEEIDKEIVEQQKKKFKIHKPVVNANVIRGSLALVCLTIGANIAFGGITTGMMGAGAHTSIDGLTVYSGLADAVSALFGGAPVEAIISATASAPDPMWSGIIMMGLMAIILVTGLLPKIAEYVPAASIAGFLLVLGIFFTVSPNLTIAFTGANPLASSVTMVVTSISDPFIGLVSGIAVKLLGGLL